MRTIVTFVGPIGLVRAINTVFTNYCSQQVIAQASEEGFFQYVLTNCIPLVSSESGENNWLGEMAFTPSECLSHWIATHTDGNHIPSAGPCRDSYQELIDGLTYFTDIDSLCTFHITTGSLKCGTLSINAITEVTSTFRAAAGGCVESQVCSSAVVRKLSNADIYSKFVQGAYAQATDDSWIQAVPDDVDGRCYGCYHVNFLSLVETRPVASPSGLMAACREDPKSDSCMNSTWVQNVLAEFQLCSGGFPMIFDGPVCTETDVNEIQQLIPAPYFTFAHCAFNPNDVFCATTPAYIAQIRADSDSSCVSCYQDFFAAVKMQAKSAETSTACTGGEGVWSADCVVALGDALFNFEACSGFDLSTEKGSYSAPAHT